MEFTTLNNGIKMPLVGFGAMLMSPDPAQTEKAVIEAIQAGYHQTSCKPGGMSSL